MFPYQKITSGLLGASLAVGAMELANEAFAVDAVTPVPASATLNETFHIQHGENLNVQSRVNRFSGALTSAEAPLYEGPVNWVNYPIGLDLTVGTVLGLFGGLFGAGVGLCNGVYNERKNDNESPFKKALAGAGLGFIIPFGIGLYSHESIKILQFETTVSSSITEKPHNETFDSGKRKVEKGPFYRQSIQIPETDLSLHANNFGQPFLDGEKIKASFFLDNNNHIVFWYAEPAIK
jgi:hypothetical protein